MATKWYWDQGLLLTAFALVMVGVLMVASASFAISQKQFGMPFHFFYHHLFYVLVGLLAAGACLFIPLNVWQGFAPYAFLLSLALLVMVLIPGLGVHMNGSVRWLRLGPLTLQASECMKLAAILYFSDFLSRQRAHVRYSPQGFCTCLILLAIISVLLLLEPDFGATLVITVVTFVLLLVAGVRLRYLMYLCGLAGSVLAILAISAPYRLLRLTSFLDPWRTRFGSGYQLTQALIAFGRGGITGQGLGHGVQKQFYLPEAHTDFIFAVLAEEGGLIACLIVITLFLYLVLRGCWVARELIRQNQLFAGYLSYGISVWLGFQGMINVGVNIGLLPTKGLTLPLVSYGGTSIVITCVACAWLLRASHEMASHPLRTCQ